ncbi:FAD-binding oxidoreductase [Streptomyces sp. AS58]|uniref:FAD-binding oxidoreductase n=1 Tax=Streptomyces sp. AS58 TaxID=1519489 RepID=UPI0006B017EC|nr:FAD-binding oxidoreductase [Streptomyces sp. AS58]
MAPGNSHDISARHLWERELENLTADAFGPVLTPGAAGYEDEIAVFNPAVTHSPAVVVGATGPEDVSLAVRTAGRLGLNIAVLNTGHGPSVPATGDTLLITTSRMSDIVIDPCTRTARVQAGVRFQQLVTSAAAHGLAPLPGSSPTVGVIGYTLGGGGSATMGRKYGWAADHVTALEVVTADGEPHRVSADTESDLFSALLGGKSNFGVVTAMECALFPVTHLYAGTLCFSGADARAALESYRRFTATAPDDMTSGIAFLYFPPLPGLPAFMQGKPVVAIRISHVGQEDEGERLIAPLRQAAPVLLDTVSMKPYTEFGSIGMDPADPAPAVEHFGLLTEMTESTVDALADTVDPHSGNRVNLIDIRQLGGAYSRPPATANAVGARDAAFAIFALTVVPPGQDVAAYANTGLELFDRLAPWLSKRKHPGFLSPADATGQQTQKAYDPDVYEWLRAVKTRYDPDNRFRVNHNIPPYETA